jgi:hypothetical protein
MEAFPGMSLLGAVELVTGDLGKRLDLYRSVSGSGQAADGADHPQRGATIERGLLLLERRAAAEGFVV